SAQLNLDFGSTLPSKASLDDVLDRPASAMDTALDKILAHQKTAYSAIIIVWVAGKQSSLETIATELAAQVLKPTFSDDVVGTSISLGLSKAGFNRTIEI